MEKNIFHRLKLWNRKGRTQLEVTLTWEPVRIFATKSGGFCGYWWIDNSISQLIIAILRQHNSSETEKYDQIDYYLIQLLSGHEYFRSYVPKIRKLPFPDYIYCKIGKICPTVWKLHRFFTEGNQVLLDYLIEVMLQSQGMWNRIGHSTQHFHQVNLTFFRTVTYACWPPSIFSLILISSIKFPYCIRPILLILLNKEVNYRSLYLPPFEWFQHRTHFLCFWEVSFILGDMYKYTPHNTKW